ncbi:O-antigen ligase family protein [Leptolyngbya sp. AN02str]|uniref:O-antigen ligase family protein n=1 Tax=Leptolyngbya sp. AN02str TaxID=3423363 RepID=UPI003D31E8D1
MGFKRLLYWFEQAFTVFALILYSGGPLQVILSGGVSEGDVVTAETDYALIRMLCLLTYVVFTGLLALRWRLSLWGLVKGWPVFALVGLAALSIFWSDFPGFTQQRSIALIGTSLFGLYFGTRFSMKQQLQLLGWAMAIAVLMSIAFVAALPKYGIMGGKHAGAWRGIFSHKNVTGRAMAFSSVVFLLLSLQTGGARLFWWLLLVTTIAFTVMAQSTTALLCLVVLFLLFFILRPLRWHYRARTIAVLSLVLAVAGGLASVLANSETLLAAFGKDTTLTGRTDLWPAVIEKIQLKPIWGFGYEGFWRGWDSDAAEVWRTVGWDAPHSHNGFLDLLLALGLVGFIIFMTEYFTTLARAAYRLKQTRNPEYYLPILFLAFTVLFSLTESTILGRNSIFWVMYVAMSVSARLPLQQPKSNAQPSTPNYSLPSSAQTTA